MIDCTFCQIVNYQIPANILLENDDLMVILDVDPISDGHALIIPKRHLKDLFNLDEKMGSEIMKTAAIVGNCLLETFNYDGIMTMQVNGIFQDVPHFHMHVFGRRQSEDIEIKYPPEINKSLENLEQIKLTMKQNIST